MAYSIIIVDDHQLMAQGIAKFFKGHPSFEVMEVYDDPQEAFTKIKILKPDLLLTDLDMPVWNGLELIEKVRAVHPACKSVLLTMHLNRSVVKKCMDSGVNGYLPKNADEYEFIQCVEAVSTGRQYYSQKALETLVSGAKEIEQTGLKKTQNLTNRELEILKLVAEGFSTKEISEQLFIAVRTTETHRKTLMTKLDVNNVAGLVRIAVQEGLLD